MPKATPILLAAALSAVLAAPALAQNANPMASTQYPPSPGNSNETLAQPLNSLPQSAATAERSRPGSDVATIPTAPAASGAPDTTAPAR